MLEDFYTSTKENQLQIIINLISRSGEAEVINEYTKFYEETHQSSFLFDEMRYNYSFLKHVTLYQAIKLYDALAQEVKEFYLDVIEIDHFHLHELLKITQILESFVLEEQPQLKYS